MYAVRSFISYQVHSVHPTVQKLCICCHSELICAIAIIQSTALTRIMSIMSESPSADFWSSSIKVGSHFGNNHRLSFPLSALYFLSFKATLCSNNTLDHMVADRSADKRAPDNTTEWGRSTTALNKKPPHWWRTDKNLSVICCQQKWCGYMKFTLITLISWI